MKSERRNSRWLLNSLPADAVSCYSFIEDYSDNFGWSAGVPPPDDLGAGDIAATENGCRYNL